ncbi:MAG: histidine kinase dimerization/phospho-acceptor domain-containing protein [Minisyncoccota bacterium]
MKHNPSPHGQQDIPKGGWAVVAHDIRNILAVIKTDVEIALMGEASINELRETLVRIDKEADQINTKLNES